MKYCVNRNNPFPSTDMPDKERNTTHWETYSYNWNKYYRRTDGRKGENESLLSQQQKKKLTTCKILLQIIDKRIWHLEWRTKSERIAYPTALIHTAYSRPVSSFEFDWRVRLNGSSVALKCIQSLLMLFACPSLGRLLNVNCPAPIQETQYRLPWNEILSFRSPSAFQRKKKRVFLAAFIQRKDLNRNWNPVRSCFVFTSWLRSPDLHFQRPYLWDFFAWRAYFWPFCKEVCSKYLWVTREPRLA